MEHRLEQARPEDELSLGRTLEQRVQYRDIEVPGRGTFQFPQSMSDDQIKDVIKRKILTPPLAAPATPITPAAAGAIPPPTPTTLTPPGAPAPPTPSPQAPTEPFSDPMSGAPMPGPGKDTGRQYDPRSTQLGPLTIPTGRISNIPGEVAHEAAEGIKSFGKTFTRPPREGVTGTMKDLVQNTWDILQSGFEVAGAPVTGTMKAMVSDPLREAGMEKTAKGADIVAGIIGPAPTLRAVKMARTSLQKVVNPAAVDPMGEASKALIRETGGTAARETAMK